MQPAMTSSNQRPSRSPVHVNNGLDPFSHGAVRTLCSINGGLHAFAAIMPEYDDVLNIERFHSVCHSRVPSQVQS